MREVDFHKINPVNDVLKLAAVDGPGPGGANHAYDVTLPTGMVWHFAFQNGPIGEAGINGLTNEVLIAMVIDRMRAFQDGAYACEENAFALGYLQAALAEMKKRTDKRVARGVEGTSAA